MLYEISKLQCSYDKSFDSERSKVVLSIEHLSVPRGKRIFIVGESGIGKSTILEVLGMMNNTIIPNKETKFMFYGTDSEAVDLLAMWQRNNDDELSAFRRNNFNFIFQSTNLMRNFTAYENVSITRMLQGYSRQEAFERAKEVLKDLRLEAVNESRMAQELSGGQQQRLAFARAIVPNFTVLFGDEPTGNLDADNARMAMELLSRNLEEKNGSSAIIVSHDMHLAVDFADVIIKIYKKANEKFDPTDDSTFHGVINDESMFVPIDEQKKEWSNGVKKMSAIEFEEFLKKG